MEDLHILLLKRLAVEILVKVNLRVFRGQRIECSNGVCLIVLLPSDVEMMGRVVRSVLCNVGILNREICNTSRYDCQSAGKVHN